MRIRELLMAIAAVAMVVGPVWAQAEDKPEGKAGNVVVTKDAHVTVTFTAQEGKDGKPRVKVNTLRAGPGEKPQAEQAAKGWIGIRISPVPAALDQQLGLDGKGVMVGNVVKGSPADKAGLDRYDVIVATDKGERVEGAEQFVSGIQNHPPGQKVRLTVLRKAQKQDVTVTLGEMPAGPEGWEYIHEEDPDEQWADQLKLHRGLLKKGPGGWVFEGPKGGIEIELPKAIMEVLPKGTWGDVQIHALGTGGAKKSFKISRSVDGRRIDIESGKDGEIIVRRCEPGDDGKGEVTKTYKSAEELKKDNADLYEWYKSLNLPGQDAGLNMKLNYAWPPKAMTKEAAEAIQKAQEQLREHMKTWADKARQKADEARERIARAVEPEPVERQFDVGDDGRIKVRVREGGSEAKLVFKDENEMKQKAPRLYAAYEKLLKGER